MSGRLRQRCLIAPRETATVTIRGVQWVTDRYVMVRADALRTVPKPKPDMRVKASGVREVLDRARGDGYDLTDSGIRLDNRAWPRAESYPVALLMHHSRYVALNGDAADEWLSHEWASIKQGDTFVEFRELRRGRPVLVGVVMPVRLGTELHSIRAAS